MSVPVAELLRQLQIGFGSDLGAAVVAPPPVLVLGLGVRAEVVP